MGKCWVLVSKRDQGKARLSFRRLWSRCGLHSREETKVSRESRWVRISLLHLILEAEASPTRAGGNFGGGQHSSLTFQREKLRPGRGLGREGIN